MNDRPDHRPGAHNPHASDNPRDITLGDLMLFLRRGSRWLASCTGIGLVAGLSYAFLAPPKYVATANIQTAVVANDQIETPPTLAEKLRMPLYYSEQVRQACDRQPGEAEGESLVRELNPAVNRSAPIVTIKYERESAESAERCLTAIFQHVRVTQSVLSKPVLDSKKEQLAVLKQRLADAKQLEGAISPHAAAALKGEGSQTTPALLLSALSVSNQNVRELITEIGKLEVALGPIQTRETQLATPIYIQQTLTPSRRALVGVAATLAGLFLGIVIVVSSAVWSRVSKDAPAR